MSVLSAQARYSWLYSKTVSGILTSSYHFDVSYGVHFDRDLGLNQLFMQQKGGGACRLTAGSTPNHLLLSLAPTDQFHQNKLVLPVKVEWEGQRLAHQAEAGRHRSAPVVVAAAELEVEQQSVVGNQVEAVSVHQRLAAQRVS